MRTLLSLAITGIGLSVALSSCTIEKRKHMAGYHLEWHNSKDRVKSIEKSDALTKDVAEPIAEAPVMDAPAAVDAPAQTITVSAAPEVDVTASASTEVKATKRSVLSRMTSAQAERVETIVNNAELAAAMGAMSMTKKEVKKLNAAGGATSSKWFKYWLIAWGVAILLSILAVALISPAIWIVSWLAWLAGTVFFIIWLIEVLS